MRELATSKTPNLPALDYPASITPSFSIPVLPVQQMTLPVQTPYQLAYAQSQAKLNGVYVIGSNTCPNCGDFKHLREVSGMWVWYCCYSACNECDEPHAYLDASVCDHCNGHTGCDCTECSECDSEVECSECDKCSSCCTCDQCSSYGCTNKLKDHGSCDTCEVCLECCECYYCNGCDSKVGGDNFCGDCEHCESCCSCHEESDDDAKNEGYSEVAGWVRRGRSVVAQHQEVDCNPWKRVDPVQSMADFYLLSYMVEGNDPSQMAVARVAASQREALVNVLDPAFSSYLDIAVGGELRHHRAINMMSGGREAAWGQWRSIREQLGAEVLLDAAELFVEMSGGYGGDCWAAGARILHSRITGKIPPWVFVDRVFTMQHNNGSILNKVGWAHRHYLENGVDLCQSIGTAHAAIVTDLELLLFVASPATQDVFNLWWTARNRGLMAVGGRPELRPSYRDCVKMPFGDNGYFVCTTGLFTLDARYRARDRELTGLARRAKARREAEAATAANEADLQALLDEAAAVEAASAALNTTYLTKENA